LLCAKTLMLRSYALRVSEPQRLPFAQPKIKSHQSYYMSFACLKIFEDS